MFKGTSCEMVGVSFLTAVFALAPVIASAVPYKLGVAGYTFHAQTLEQALLNMKTNDCHYLCHKADFLPYDADVAAIADFKRKLAAFGVESLASGPLYVKDEASLRQQFEFARRYGLKIVVGVPYEDVKTGDWSDRVESVKMLDAVEKLVKEFDICYAIHNHGPDIPRLFPTAESVMSLIGKRDKRIGVCLDIGHERRAGLDPVAFIRAHPDRVFDVHLKNIRIDAKENFAVPGPRGELKVFDILLALAEVGYSGVCHIEYERDFHDNMRGLAESVGYYRGCMDAVDSVLSDRSMRLMSFNVCHCSGMDGKINIERTALRIRTENPDFACLQELDRCTKRSGLVDQPAELARLTGLYATFAKAIPLQGGQYGVMVLSREKPTNVVQVPLPGQEPRVLLLCEFGECVVGTTHLSVAAEAERIESIDLIRRAVTPFVGKKPVFLTGDWNSVPDSPVLKGLSEFLQVASKTDCQTFHGQLPNGTADCRRDMSDFCIDYIACDRVSSGSFKIMEAYVVEDRMTSDHAPIIVTLEPSGGKPSQMTCISASFD